MPQSQKWAPVVQIFWPFTTHSSPSWTAVVRRPARSDPAEGSLKNAQGKLANDAFVNNAPEQVVQGERDRVAELEARIADLDEQISTLEAL